MPRWHCEKVPGGTIRIFFINYGDQIETKFWGSFGGLAMNRRQTTDSTKQHPAFTLLHKEICEFFHIFLRTSGKQTISSRLVHASAHPVILNDSQMRLLK